MMLDRALLRNLPTTRSLNSFVTFVPGVATSSNDVVFEPALVSFPIFGGRPLEGRVTIDGTPVTAGPDGGQGGHYIVGSIQEVAITTSGRLGEAENAGAAGQRRPPGRRQRVSRIAFKWPGTRPAWCATT